MGSNTTNDQLEEGVVLTNDVVKVKQDFEEHQQLAAVQEPEPNEIDHFKEAEKQLSELLSIAGDITNRLTMVGEFAVFFDMNAIRQEGVMDVEKIDQQRLLTIGQQMLKDYNVFRKTAINLNGQLQKLSTEFNQVKGTNDFNKLEEIMYMATDIQSSYLDWSESFSRLVVGAMHDIAALLNPLRPADKQITL